MTIMTIPAPALAAVGSFRRPLGVPGAEDLPGGFFVGPPGNPSSQRKGIVARAAQPGPWTPPTNSGERAIDEAARSDWNAPAKPAAAKTGIALHLELARQAQASPTVAAAPAPPIGSDEIARIEWAAWPRLHQEHASLEAYQAHRRAGGWVAPSKPLAAAPSATTIPASLAHLAIEDQCKAQWSTDPNIRAEFGKLEYFVAFKKADAKGLIRIHSGGAVQRFPNPNARKR